MRTRTAKTLNLPFKVTVRVTDVVKPRKRSLQSRLRKETLLLGRRRRGTDAKGRAPLTPLEDLV